MPIFGATTAILQGPDGLPGRRRIFGRPASSDRDNAAAAGNSPFFDHASRDNPLRRRKDVGPWPDERISMTRHCIRAAVLTAFLALGAGTALADRIKNPTAVFSGLDKITGRIVSFEVGGRRDRAVRRAADDAAGMLHAARRPRARTPRASSRSTRSAWTNKYRRDLHRLDVRRRAPACTASSTRSTTSGSSTAKAARRSSPSRRRRIDDRRRRPCRPAAPARPGRATSSRRPIRTLPRCASPPPGGAPACRRAPAPAGAALLPGRSRRGAGHPQRPRQRTVGKLRSALTIAASASAPADDPAARPGVPVGR